MFTAIDVPLAYGSVYRSESWEIRHYEAGFGIWKADVLPRIGRGAGTVAHGFAGPRALQYAQEWCHDRRASEGRDAA